MKTFGERLRAAREWAGLSAEALAEVGDYSAHQIYAWEKGRAEPPARFTIIGIAICLRVDALWLETGEGQMELADGDVNAQLKSLGTWVRAQAGQLHALKAQVGRLQRAAAESRATYRAKKKRPRKRPTDGQRVPSSR